MNEENSNFQDIVKTVLTEKNIIIKVTSAFAVLTMLFSLTLTNYFKSETLLIVKSETRSNMLGQMGGLASLAGISLGSTTTDKASEAIEIIKSRSFLNHLLTFDDVLPSIMASERFNKKEGTLTFDSGIYDPSTKQWTDGQPPSYLETHDIYLDEMIEVSQDKMTSIITISIEHISPVFAKEFLSLIIKEADMILRNRDLNESSKALKYLQSEAEKANKLEIRELVNSLIEEQLQTQMMANIDEDYLLVIIEPPFIPEKKAGPARLQITIIGTILGLLLSIIFVLWKSGFTIKEQL